MLIFIADLSAQDVIDRTKDSATEKTDRRIEDNINEQLDSGLDALEGLFKRKNKKKKSQDEPAETVPAVEERVQETPDAETEPSDMGFDMSAFLKPAKYDDSYSFDIHMVSEMTTINKKGKEENMTMEFFKQDGENTAMRVKSAEKGDESMFLILDYGNESMITITEEKGEQQAFAMPMMKAYLGTDESYQEMIEENMEDFNLEKTGRTKTILGYSCDEYQITSKDTNGTVWMTEDAGISTMELMGKLMQNNKTLSDTKFSWMQNGLMMESETVDLKSGDTTIQKVTLMDTDADVTFDMDDYNVMGIGQ